MSRSLYYGESCWWSLNGKFVALASKQWNHVAQRFQAPKLSRQVGLNIFSSGCDKPQFAPAEEKDPLNKNSGLLAAFKFIGGSVTELRISATWPSNGDWFLESWPACIRSQFLGKLEMNSKNWLDSHKPSKRTQIPTPVSVNFVRFHCCFSQIISLLLFTDNRYKKFVSRVLLRTNPGVVPAVRTIFFWIFAQIFNK